MCVHKQVKVFKLVELCECVDRRCEKAIELIILNKSIAIVEQMYLVFGFRGKFLQGHVFICELISLQINSFIFFLFVIDIKHSTEIEREERNKGDIVDSIVLTNP